MRYPARPPARRPGPGLAGRSPRADATPPAARSGAAMLAVYTGTMFISAALLFMVQPMFAKMALPLLGGSPSVWNTSLVFFQVALLGGYLYAHFVVQRLGVRRAALVHAGLVLAPLLVLPVAVPAGWTPPAEGNPVPWLLALLGVSVGLPFFVLSTTSPLLQAWFARTGHRQAADPYFLYAASNAGSMLALIAYPLLIEPRLRLTEQREWWAAGYLLLAVFILTCAAIVWRATSGRAARPQLRLVPTSAAARASRLDRRRVARWILLSAVPSSLLISVTTTLQTTVAPIPLIWVAPLSLYLLTYIFVFSPRFAGLNQALTRFLPVTLAALAMLMAAHISGPLALLIGFHLGVGFIATMVCHGQLANDRPAAEHVTTFYICLSVGGALGGMFNGFVAPLVFSSVTEYPLALVILCLLLPGSGEATWVKRALVAVLGVLVLLLAVGVPGPDLRLPMPGVLAVLGVGALAAFAAARRPLRLALGIAAMFVAGGVLYTGQEGRTLHTERTFFGLHRVLLDGTGRYRVLVNGSTQHGRQALDPARRREPLMYYTQSGPIGQVFTALPRKANQRVAVVGLGSGALACYQQPGESWTFYEIDPAVIRIARDPRYFTYLADCAPDAAMVVGDARLAMRSAEAGAYDLIVLDAFSSDTPPVHLLTREALALYMEKLAPGGVLAYHISNVYLDLRPVVAGIANDAGLLAYTRDDDRITYTELDNGKSGSRWAVLARDQADIAPLITDPRWRPAVLDPSLPVWTDEYSSILRILGR